MQHSTPGMLPPAPASAITNGTSRPNMPPQPHPTTFQLLIGRLHRSIHNVFTQASTMLLSEEPNASQLFEQLEQLTIASDQMLLYLIDTDSLLQLENGNVYPASLPLSMSSTREEYWRSAYDTMRLQWAVMDKLRSRHDILKQAAADFWPAQPQPTQPTPVHTTEAQSDAPAAKQSTKQDEQMDDSSTAAASTGVVAVNHDSSAAVMDGAHHQPATQHIDLTQPTTQHIDLTQPNTDNNSTTHTADPTPPLPLTDTTAAGSSSSSTDAMADVPLTVPHTVELSPLPPTPNASVLLTPSAQQVLTPLLTQPVESPSQLERPELIASARSVMDLTDDV